MTAAIRRPDTTENNDLAGTGGSFQTGERGVKQVGEALGLTAGRRLGGAGAGQDCFGSGEWGGPFGASCMIFHTFRRSDPAHEIVRLGRPLHDTGTGSG